MTVRKPTVTILIILIESIYYKLYFKNANLFANLLFLENYFSKIILQDKI